MKSFIEEFINLLDEAEGIKTAKSLQEKIMSKGQAKKNALIRQQNAQAAQTQNEQPAAEDDVIEGELVDDSENSDDGDNDSGDSGNDNGNDDTDNTPKKELIKYNEEILKEPDDLKDELSEKFVKFIQVLYNLVQTYLKERERGIDLWKSTDPMKEIPKEAWEIMYNALVALKQGVDSSVNTYCAIAEDMTSYEWQTLDMFVTALNSCIQKEEKQISSIQPGLTKEDLLDGRVDTKDLTTDADELKLLTTQDNGEEEEEKPQSQDKRKIRKIIDADTFIKHSSPMADCMNTILKKLQQVLKTTAEALWKMSKSVFNWFEERLWSFINSPLAKDFVKTLMYINPITAMIFDGSFGSLGIMDSLNKIRQNAKKQGDPNQFKDKTTKLPINIDKMNLQQIKKAFYGNQEFVTLVNNSYNHDQVNKQYKAELLKYSGGVIKAINEKKIEDARSNMKKLVNTCENIIDSMSWKTPKDWGVLSKVTGHIKGLTDAEVKALKNIKVKSKGESKVPEAVAILKRGGKHSDSEILKILTGTNYGYPQDEVKTAIANYHESYNGLNIRKMFRLLEAAES